MPSTPEASPSSTPSPEETVTRPELILRANLSERPARLIPVARIPFGTRPQDVGLIDDPRRASRPVFPMSFTVASDGSFWLIDEVNRRLAHYDHEGRYLGQIGGLRFDRFHPQPQDLAAVGDTLWLLQQDHQHFLLSDLREYRAGRLVATADMADEDGPVVVAGLVSGPDGGLVGLSGGLAGDVEHFGEGRKGYVSLSATPAPNVRAIDGIPIADGTNVTGTFDPERPDDRYLLSVFGRGPPTTFPVRFVLTANGSESARRIPGNVGFQMQAVLPGRVAVWVPTAPTRPEDADRYGGGVWLLEFPIDGSPIVWERLPAPGLSSEAQVRSLAAGPDGTLYFMLAGRDGMTIYRIPTP
jgi:hypothetical protein